MSGAGPVPRVLAAGGPALEEAAGRLLDGEVVGIPTDTVYGLAVDPTRPGATGRLFAAKDRPRAVTLPVLVAGIDQAETLSAEVPTPARRLMARWWPGPLTLVLERRAGLALDLGDDGTSIGMRCAAHPVPAALIERVGPIATTSANRHGAPASSTAAQLRPLPGVAVVIDAGTCDGTPSTVLDCRGGELRLVRAGRIGWDDLVASAR